jgi:hypothetical protein
MKTLMCNEHSNGQPVDARMRAHVSTGLAIATSWTFATKPYGYKRLSGAPPG